MCLLLVLCTLSSNAQTLNPVSPTPTQNTNKEFCGTDFFHNQKMLTDSVYRARHLKSIKSFENITTNQQRQQNNGIYQIPVVVHVMHKGEQVGSGTNISDDDVKKGIASLNNYWRKLNGTFGDGDGVDMKIEFVLAIQDENGNCTNGIDRVNMSGVSAYVNNGVNANGTSGINDYDASGGVNSLKEYSIWNPNLYYNVWLVDEIDNANCSSSGSFTAGYAYYASAHGFA
ncbi:MAG: hypothetical protein NWQ14_05715, partial [Flavobacterium sp.]|nr:hypothetical protein [Flavobacterium sp.]